MVSESREHITFRKNLLEFDELKIQKLPTFYAAYSFLIKISFKRNYINSKMIQREAEAAENSNTTTSSSTTSTTTASTTSWSRLKDPRIVRVSRAYGGKDRHSKVCTVRGLRDRRVRLSVPTAIQLYDLQERLGLNQPSKVVDWLLNAAKNEIDELPPLQIPQGGFSINPNIDQYHHQHHASQSDGQVLIKNEEGCSRQFNLENNIPISSNFPIYNSFVRWDLSSNTTLSQNSSRNLIGSTGDDDLQNLSLVNPSLGSHHQVFVYQPGLINQQYNNFPSSNSSPPLSLDHHHSNTTQLPVIRPFHFSMNDANLNLPLQDNADNEQN